MGDSSTIPGGGQTTNSGLANQFLNNGPLPQTYSPQAMPSAPSASFSALSKPGSLAGLTGSLIGGNGMPALPKPTGPMNVPPPVAAPATGPAPFSNPGLYYAGPNIQRGGMASFGGTPGNVTGGKPLAKGQQGFRVNREGR